MSNQEKSIGVQVKCLLDHGWPLDEASFEFRPVCQPICPSFCNAVVSGLTCYFF